MAPITQIQLLSLRVSVEPEVIVVNGAVTLLREQKSIRHFRWSMLLQEENKLCIFVDWDEKSALDGYLQSDAYQQLLQFINSQTTEPITSHSVLFDPYATAVLDNKGGHGTSPVAQVLYMYFGGAETESEDFQDTATTTVEQFLQKIGQTTTGMTGESSIGWLLDDVAFKGEMCRACVLVVGWQSVESQLQFLASPDFKSAFPIIASMQGFRGAHKTFFQIIP
ncbi:hypothetical protein THAR02_00875 [Trichoderma harzianum]|uniref:ABM domain-containing protein n=1 Tax=Trichoderma harzianum TaxID=5544 RepID=A0A0F9XQS2_TRIHA|nr:hypothetical protein THAR02_00875 [Trichoderma harzianum]